MQHIADNADIEHFFKELSLIWKTDVEAGKDPSWDLFLAASRRVGGAKSVRYAEESLILFGRSYNATYAPARGTEEFLGHLRHLPSGHVLFQDSDAKSINNGLVILVVGKDDVGTLCVRSFAERSTFEYPLEITTDIQRAHFSPSQANGCAACVGEIGDRDRPDVFWSVDASRWAVMLPILREWFLKPAE